MKEAVSLYIHIPYCVSKCSYCDFFSVAIGTELIPQTYVDALCKELAFRINEYNSTFVKTVYIGGGTPSLLKRNQLIQICNVIFSKLTPTQDFEFTIEANPDDITQELLAVFEECKINRISCGIQSMNNDCLNFVKRRAGSKENGVAMELLKSKWKGQLSLDLICGLPNESEESFLDALKQIISINPQHVSMYSLTIEEETPLGQFFENSSHSYDYNFSDELWLKGRDFLCKNGYEQYEVSNFSRKGYFCKHNLVYWMHEDYLGCGSGGTGTVYDKNGIGFRWTNSTNLKDYINYWTQSSQISKNDIPQNIEIIEKDDSVFEYFMMGFRKLSGISQQDFINRFGMDIPENAKNIFEKWQCEKLMNIMGNEKNKSYSLNEKGILFLNRLLEELL